VTPARIDDLTARRLGQDVYLQFSVPKANSDGKSPADVESVDVLAITGEPLDLAGRSLDATSLAREALVVRSVAVQPPPPPESEKDRRKREKEEEERRQRGEPPPPPPVVPPDPRPKQGDQVTLVERLGPEVLTPYVPHLGKPLPPPEPVEGVQWPLPVMPREIPPLRRVYVVAGRSSKGRLGGLSTRLGVPLVELPPSPPAPVLEHVATGVVVEWTVPAGARVALQRSEDPDAQPARLLFPPAIPHTYNVYAHSGAGSVPADGRAAAVSPLNPQPLSVMKFEDAAPAFGVERCYVVRTVEAAGTVTVESEPSPPACITPADTFPPAAPAGLAAVGSEGAINLIWEPSASTDLAGYLVLRGEAGGGDLQVLTPEPIKETTYRDAAVRRGTRYVYAVVALDGATPPNRSPESNRVQETAR
jgi:hypothetical protein